MIVEDKDVEYEGTDGVPSATQDDEVGRARNPGDWRVFKPEMHHDKCIACNMCWAACPDSAISLNKEGKPVIDYNLCKGCLICKQVCKIEGAVTHKRDPHEEG